MGVANIEVAEALTFELGSRRDGVLVAWPECNLVAGERVTIWLDPTKVTGGRWLQSVDNEGTDDPVAVAIEEVDVTRELVAIALDLREAEGGERVTLGCDIHTEATQTLKAALVINVTAPAIVIEGS